MAVKQNSRTRSTRVPPITLLHRRLDVLQRLVPMALVLLVVFYELGPARWVYDSLGESYHFLAEMLFYGTIGPILAFLVLHFLARWLEERETTEAQAQVLAQTREHARISHELSDDALQTLFAASTLLATLKSHSPHLPPEAASTLSQTEQALERAIQQLRDHLQT